MARRLLGKKQKRVTARDLLFHFVMGSGNEEILAIRVTAAERIDDFFAHLVATRADTRADGGQQIRRTRSENPHHLSHRFFHHARKGSAPSGVNGGHRTLAGVREQNGHAVCGPNGE